MRLAKAVSTREIGTELSRVLGLTFIYHIGFGLLAQADTAVAAKPLAADGSKDAAAKQPDIWTILASPVNLMVVALLAFWLIVVLPQQRSMKAKQQALQKMLDDLKKNDRVVTSAGIHGVVVHKSPEAGTVTIRIDDSSNAKLTIDRASIVRVVSDATND